MLELMRIALLAVALLSCARKDEPPPAARGGGPAVDVSRESASEAIARARCDHLFTCGHVAIGKKHDTLDDCQTNERTEVRGELGRCPALARAKVDECVASLRAKTCDAFFVSWPKACERDVLCE